MKKNSILLSSAAILVFLAAILIPSDATPSLRPTDLAEDSLTMLPSQEKAIDTITVALTGDILMGTTFPTERLPRNNGRDLFKDAAPFLTASDLSVGNLEGTLCDGGSTKKKVSNVSYAFRTPTSYVGLLVDAGYDFVSMANNHARDFGLEGIISTERALEDAGICFAGISDRSEKTLLERNGVKFGLCAFGHNSYTPKTWDTTTVAQILDTLRKQADILIVSFHGGAEGAAHRHLPNGPETFLQEQRGDLRKFAHFCIDHGTDIVFGHGPHVPRCIELYQDRFIAYSLGNFCTPYGINISGVSGLAPLIAVRLTTEGNFLDARIHSFRQVYGEGPRADSQVGAAREIRALTAADIPDSKLEILDDGLVRRKSER